MTPFRRLSSPSRVLSHGASASSRTYSWAWGGMREPCRSSRREHRVVSLETPLSIFISRFKPKSKGSNPEHVRVAPKWMLESPRSDIKYRGNSYTYDAFPVISSARPSHFENPLVYEVLVCEPLARHERGPIRELGIQESAVTMADRRDDAAALPDGARDLLKLRAVREVPHDGVK